MKHRTLYFLKLYFLKSGSLRHKPCHSMFMIRNFVRVRTPHTCLAPKTSSFIGGQRRAYNSSISTSSFIVPISILIGIPLAVYAYKCTMMVIFQNKLIYLPYVPLGSRNEQLTSDMTQGLEVTDTTISLPDGTKLKGFIASKSGAKISHGPILIYFQGNAGNMLHRLPLFRLLADKMPTARFVGICYRGYGESSGRPSERGLQVDARAIFNYVNKLFPSQPIYLYGHSLGGAVAIQLGSELNGDTRIKGLIVENTFISIEEMVKAIYPFLPYRYLTKKSLRLLRSRWESHLTISKVAVPVLFLSGEKDEMVPSEHMRSLYNLNSTNPKTRFISFPNGLHMDTFSQKGYSEAIAKFIEDTF